MNKRNENKTAVLQADKTAAGEATLGNAALSSAASDPNSTDDGGNGQIKIPKWYADKFLTKGQISYLEQLPQWYADRVLTWLQSGKKFSYLEQAQWYADKVLTWLRLDDVSDDFIKADLNSFSDVYANVLTDAERASLSKHINERISTDLPENARLKAEHLFFGEGSGAYPFDPVAEFEKILANVVNKAPCTTWADMDGSTGSISWAWEGWLPNGFLTILASEPGVGKSLLCLRIAASILRGDAWPDGSAYGGEQGAVLWCEAEAAQALNLERAKVWNLPLDKLWTAFDDPYTTISLDRSDHRKAIAEMAHRPEIQLIVIDSLRGVYRGDENSSVSVAIVKLLAELARNTNKPILLTHHLRKRGLFDLGDDKVSLDRIRGSSAIIQMARLVWAIDCPNMSNEKYKRLSVIKSNLARFPESIGFSIGDEMELTFGVAPEAPRQETQLDKAIDLLKALLDGEPMWSADLREEAEGAGLSWDTMKRAKEKLGIVSKRDGKLKKWSWALPAGGGDEIH